MPRAEIDADGVRRAIAEFDRDGRAAFLQRYGFGESRDYFLIHEGRQYDSKAIVAVANQWASGGGGRALAPSELSGGIGDAAKRLRELGFEVTKPVPKIDWSWDEHVLALDLYMSNPNPPKNGEEVRSLSALLNALGAQSGAPLPDKFRNANGVYMKLMNFRRFDPAYQSEGKSGLSQGGRGEEPVWRAYQGKRDALRAAALEIRSRVELPAGESPGRVHAPSQSWGADKTAGSGRDAREQSILAMRDSIQGTVRNANGQVVERTLKNKDLRMTGEELDALLRELLVLQDARCALTGISFEFHGPGADRHRLPSADRIDSNGHYERGNLQLVCQFVNFWKRDTENAEFKRLLALVRG